jgi:hypothetical protein
MIRQPMAEMKIKNKSTPNEITIDDIFFNRNFSSGIYKLSNVKNLQLKDYCATPEKIKSEKQRIENNLIET